MDAFDAVFADGKGVKASVSRKLADGTSRSAKLAEGISPAGLTLEAFAEAGMSGVSFSKRGTDKGATLSMSKGGVTGAAARSGILAFGDPVATPAPTEEPKPGKVKNRLTPSANRVHPEPAPVA